MPRGDVAKEGTPLATLEAMRHRREGSSGGRRGLLLAALVAASGCYVTAPIKPSELVLLDGYHDGEPKGGSVQVLSPANQQVEVAGNSKIYLDLQGGTYGGTFKSINVNNGIFTGVTEQGQALQVPLASIQAARVEEPNRAVMGPLYVAGIAAGLISLGVAFLAYAFVLTPHNGTGRALRVARRAITARALGAVGWQSKSPGADAASLSPELRGALARLWTESARGEHASVPAFSRLAISLVALGAPARLVEAAHRAALEEIEHARLAFSLASAYGGEPVGPGPLPALARAPAVTATTLGELAAESLIDGCLLEGVAANVARQALARAQDPHARAALDVIARDEASHAELAWDVVGWCCDQGGEPVRRQLAGAIDRAPNSMRGPRVPERLAEALADHGWLGRPAWDDAFRRTLATVAARLDALPAGARPS
jgi:hypothetical protein